MNNIHKLGKLSIEKVFLFFFIFCLLYYPVLRHILPGSFLSAVLLLQQLAAVCFILIFIKTKYPKEQLVHLTLFLAIYFLLVAYNLFISYLYIGGMLSNFLLDPYYGLIVQNIRFLINFLCWLLAAHLMVYYASNRQIFSWYHHLFATLSVVLNLTNGFFIQPSDLNILVVNYQAWGDLFAIVGLISIAQSTRIKKYFLTALYLLLLMSIPSRSSLVAFFVACVFLYAAESKSKFLRFSLCAISLVSIFAFFLFKSELIELLRPYLEHSRHWSLIETGRSESNSVRLETIMYGIDYFFESPLFGFFGFQLNAFQNPGLYLHNWFDLIVQTGIVGLLIMILLFVSFGKAFKTKIRLETRVLYLSIFVFSLTSFIIARNYQVSYLYLGIGLGLLVIFSERDLGEE